jgi:pimeloyl-ACP methyl ester carboxylesterase
MALMPLGFVIGWGTILLSLGLLGGGGYLIWAWAQGTLAGTGYLISGVLMVAWSLLGRFLVLLLRPPAKDEPHATRSGEVQRVPRPDGTELQVESYGPPNAPLIVMTHGWGTDSTEFYYAKQHLARDFRLLLWDLPGLGESRGPRNRDYRLEKMAEDLKAVVDLVPGRPVALLGHSIGGMITQTFCRLHPEYLGNQVSALVLVDTTSTNPVRTSLFSGLMTLLQRPLLEPLCWLMLALHPLVWLSNGMSYLNGSAHIGTWLTGFAGTQSRGQLDFGARFTALSSPGVVARGMLAMFRFDATETLPKIAVPVLVICGLQDPTTRPEASYRIQELLPDAELVKLTPGSHMAHMERHPEFVQAVGDFVLRSNAAAPEVPLRRAA